MKIVPQQEAYLRKTIRTLLSLEPQISVRRLQEQMRDYTHRTISDKYLMRLLRKVRREIVYQSDNQKISARLTEIRERQLSMREQLVRIAYWVPIYFPKCGIQRPSAAERIYAIKTLAQMDLALLKAEMDVGVYEDRRAALGEMLREGLLPQELHEQVVGVFQTWKVRSSLKPPAEPYPQTRVPVQVQHHTALPQGQDI